MLTFWHFTAKHEYFHAENNLFHFAPVSPDFTIHLMRYYDFRDKDLNLNS